ncbi:ATP-grasp domain-containing protein [Parasegetibacter sp. NRK P23]|uniref:ATP-grasp domain-containing protein n=1 Tax=Parasegetibacter sp. NRK P23 TaxID=2942999 RepID=UPI0020441B3E|nr:ATP-grasp domain-containing protein [Parasegetibacter sp. NRK P23]MCM5527638.1 ATP-grasp domain-containing protein [Parasegetibacter sp. NRK P23]
MKNILITGIGGVVGQGILRNVLDLGLGTKLIGVNVVQVSAGNYMCDRVYTVPYAYEESYIQAIKDICLKEDIGIIIPSTDYEAFYLAEAQHEFDCPVAASPAVVTKMCLDKFLNFKAFEQFNIPFAASCLPSEYKGQFKGCVLKPREGRGSRNIFVNPPQPAGFDDTYVVQEYLDGPEITTTFYTKKDGQLHGFITFVRELEQGNTAKAEVTTMYDPELKPLIERMLRHFPFRGSCNIQSRVTDKGIIPFEINCRISGTNSVRSQFGFKDVAYTVQEYLLNEVPAQPEVVAGTALRVILDIIYPGMKLSDITNKEDKFYIR